VDRKWQETFRNRMHDFEARRAPKAGEAAVSIKVRVTSGCFDREHSPHAYELIDRGLTKLPGPDGLFAFEEHESGPEILVYLAVTTAGLSLAKSIVDLITAIIKARSEGIKKGDHPSEPVELIVRLVHDAQEFREETVILIGHEDAVNEAKLERQLKDALRKLLEDEPPTRTPRKKQ
jgi:hypothetical protein